MIYIIWAPPRQGKTFFATYRALREMRKTKKALKVYSNYPIISKEPLTLSQKVKNVFRKKENKIPNKVLSSYVWRPEFVYESIYDSMIVIDEAYMDYNSRKFQDFDADTHVFFATNGHNHNDIYLIAQSPARLDKIVREMTNVFYYVKKHTFPWSSNPLWFTVEGYLTEEDFVARRSNPDAVWTKEQLTLKKDVARAYDTHYYRSQKQEHKPQTWAEKLLNPVKVVFSKPVVEKEKNKNPLDLTDMEIRSISK